MRNVQTDIKGTILTLTIDCSKSFGASKSGKSKTIASTDGNPKIIVDGKQISIGLNVYTEID